MPRVFSTTHPTLEADILALTFNGDYSRQHLPRQVTTQLPTTATTSSIDWWPYPPWDTSSSLGLAGSSANLAVPAATAATPVSSVSGGSLIPTAASSAITSLSVASAAVSSVTHITALPPANSSSSGTTFGGSKKSDGSSFDIAYLSPLFAILGVLAGGLVAWIVIGLIARSRERRFARDASFQTGPRYMPPPGTGAEDMQGLRTETVSVGDASARSARSSDMLEQSSSMMINQPESQLGSAMEPPPRNYLGVLPIDHHDPAEDDPFLARFTSPRAFSATVGDQPRSAALITSPGLFADEDESAPYDTLRHKSIRRGLLDRLKFGTLRRSPTKAREQPDVEQGSAATESPTRRVSHRRGHQRKDSDLNVNDMSDTSRLSTPHRSCSVARCEGSKSPMHAGPGFRIIEEDTEADAKVLADTRQLLSSVATSGRPTPSKTDSPWTWLSSWSLSSSDKQTPADVYTSMPVRRSIAEKRSPSVTPAASRTATASAPPMPRVDSSILPSSPPRIMSPPLESKLFFGAIPPDFGATPTLNLQMPTGDAKSPKAPVASLNPPTKQQNKLHTKKQPPLLPFPSTSHSSPYRTRLKKSIRRGRTAARPDASTAVLNAPASPPSPSPSYGSGAGRRTPAERFIAQHAALDKVQEIVSQSWSQRDMSINLVVGSSTSFGALPHEAVRGGNLGTSDNAAGTPVDSGIEQRLGIHKA